MRGAHLNFGSRGTYASVGLPGTGLSYRQRLGAGRSSSRPTTLTEDQIRTIGNRENDPAALKVFQEGMQSMSLSPEEARRYAADPRFKMLDPDTGQRLTPSRLEAMIQANELKERLEHLHIQLQTEAEEYQHLLNFWKPLPAIASVAEWHTALANRPFELKLAAPAPPDMQAEQARLMDELTAKSTTGMNRYLPRFFARNDAKTEFDSAWPARDVLIQRQYQDQCQQYEQQVAAESAAWNESEAKRIDWVRKLLASDLEEVNHTVAEVLTGLQIPFQTQCDFFLQDERSVHLNVDLPGMEEVIPETTKEIFKTGETRDVRRTNADRQADYTRLVMGECLFLAAELFSYLPLAQEITVAAHTQRARKHENDPVDSYVLDVTFNREAVKVFGDGDNLTAFLVHLGGRFDVDANGGLSRIEPPSWLQPEDYKHLQ